MTAVTPGGGAQRRGGLVRRAIRHIERRWLGVPRRDLGRSELSYPSVELIWWKPKTGLNFGDVLSEVIVTKILADRGLSLRDQTDRRARLLAVGSSLHFAKDGDIIWGTGVNGKMPEERHAFSTLDVRAVRGPLTREFLRKKGIDAPQIYGDPALLLPQLFPQFRANPTTPVVVVPNLHDVSHLSAKGIDHLSPWLGWNICVEDILRAKLVVASSLHAIVVAEAFGIPARYVQFSENENLFKYEDYVLGTGRDKLEPAASIGEAREMGGMPPIRFDARKLIDAFPLDLWRPDYT
jgi:pyruvyltransferase